MSLQGNSTIWNLSTL